MLRITIGVLVILGGVAAGILLGHPFGSHLALAASKPPAAKPPATPAAHRPLTPQATPTAQATPTTQVTPQQAANGLAALLAQSGSDRQAVSTAYNDVLGCGSGLSQDRQAFTSAAVSHQRLLGQLAQLPGLSALPTAMVNDLKAAWQASISADNDFAKWTSDEISSGCSIASQSDPNFTAATGPDLQATASKKAFVADWNSLAQMYGLPAYSQSDI